MTAAKFIGVDQRWNDETTIYWFELGDEKYGIADCNGYESVVDSDGGPLPKGTELERIRRSCLVTDAMRMEAVK